MRTKNSGIKTWFLKNWRELTMVIVLTVFNALFLNYAAYSNSLPFGSKRYFLLLAISLFLEILSIVVIFFAKKKQIKMEKLFLILFIPIGLLFMFSIPIASVPDEDNHLTRAYGIANGHFIMEANEDGAFGEWIPADFAGLLTETERPYSDDTEILKADDNEYIFHSSANIAIYNFLNFLPQSTGIFIGKTLSLPWIITAYLGRLLNFVCFVLLYYFAIKKAPFGKTLFFFIAFLPIVLQEAVSLSADCLTIGISAALISLTLYLAYDKSAKLTKKSYILLLILLLFESMCKIVYLPLCFLIFLIPTSKFKSKKDHLLKTIIPIVVIIIINLIWLKIASRYLIEYNPGVNSGDQLHYIIAHPISYLQIIFNTFNNSLFPLMHGAVGGGLEYFTIYLGQIYPILSIIILTIIIYKNTENKLSISPLNRAFIIGILIVTIGLTCTSLYLQWTPVAQYSIDGLQGRYFIPLLFLAPAIACGLRNKIVTVKTTQQPDHSLLYLFSMFQCIAALIVIMSSHII